MLRPLKFLAFSTLMVFLLSASGAAATPVSFDIAGPGQADVDTDPGTEVELTSVIAGTIVDLNVFVELVGGHMEDLALFLTSPGGTVVQFRRSFLNPFTHQDGPISATFDDQAALPHDSQQSLGGVIGTFQPFEALNAFDGEQLAGLWTLTIFDQFAPGEGNDLLRWNILGVVETDQVPEPATLIMLGLGLSGLGVRRWRQRKAGS